MPLVSLITQKLICLCGSSVCYAECQVVSVCVLLFAVNRKCLQTSSFIATSLCVPLAYYMCPFNIEPADPAWHAGAELISQNDKLDSSRSTFRLLLPKYLPRSNWLVNKKQITITQHTLPSWRLFEMHISHFWYHSMVQDRYVHTLRRRRLQLRAN